MKQSQVKKEAGKTAASQANAVQMMVFENPEFGRIRTMADENGEPLFCAVDLGKVLGYEQARKAILRHVSPQDCMKRTVSVTTKRYGQEFKQNRQLYFVNESGLYFLIFGSKLDSAQRFKQWVTSVVLPQIRKTGGYIPVREGENEEETRKRAEEILRKTLELKDKLISEQTDRIRQLDRQVDDQVVKIQKAEEEIVCLERDIDRLLPKALYTDNVLNSISCYTTTQVAKELGVTTQELNRALCGMHVQYYQSGQYMLYADYAHCGLAKSRTHGWRAVEGRPIRTRTYLVWTERGREFIHRLKLHIHKLTEV